MKKLVLIDGHSILNRAFYGVPPLTNAEGLHTNAVYGFLNILFKRLDEEMPDYLAVAFDLKEPTFRHKLYDAYKGTRKPMPEELREQVPVMKEVLASMGVPILTLPGYEADDILGTAAKRAQAQGLDVTVISGDRDLLQLSDTHIKISIPKTSRGTTQIYDYYPEDVQREYHVTPTQFIDVKALMGDASDNIPGVPGIGEKTATGLIAEYGSLTEVFAHLDAVKPPRAKKNLEESRELAELSYTLARIDIDAPIACTLEDAAITDLYTAAACEWMRKLGFKSLLSRFEKEKKTDGDCPGVYEVTELSAAEQVFSEFRSERRIGVGFLAENGELTGISLCGSGEKIPVLPAGGFLTADYLTDRLLSLAETSEVWLLNVKEALPWLPGERSVKLYDAGVAAYLLNPLKGSYAYEDIAADYLKDPVPGRTELLKKLTYREAADTDRTALLNVAGYMARTAYLAAEPLILGLRETDMLSLYETVELPLIYTLYHMEAEGIAVRKEELAAYGKRLKAQIAVLEREIWELAGESFNINSPKQLGEILFGRMQLKGGKKTKTGYSTAAEVLEKLAPDYPIVRKVLEYRTYTKLNSTYADGLGAYIGPDGRIHSRFNQTITATGRISSTEPNLQNIPVRLALGREIRKAFVPKEGYVFVDADYSQIELRVLAHMSGDENLIEAYKSAQDIHAITASKVFHVPLSEVTPLMRRNAKAVNFGIVYGISAHGLSEDLDISQKEAKEFIARYYETYPQIKTFLEGLVEKARETGFAVTMFQRRRPVPELSSSNFNVRSFGERVAMNSPIQGTAADIIKIAMIRVDKRLREENLESRLILQIHDELLVETKLDELDRVKEILSGEMRQAAELRVALEIDMHDGKSWYEAK